MSFTAQVIEELAELPTGKNCCRKALLCGLFYDSQWDEKREMLQATFRFEASAALAASLLTSRYSAESQLEEETVCGRKRYRLYTHCPAIASQLAAADTENQRPLWETLSFRCGSCRAQFLRGVFLAAATVNDPAKSYHLEFSLHTERRANQLSALLSGVVAPPRRLMRGDRSCLYYKSNGNISDLIYLIGATKASFTVANCCIERDIRNHENRATNCVAKNISRSVGAIQVQVAAIEHLRAIGKLETLPEELRSTAALRLENDAASLSELALLHEPPISKSGLNRRLSRLVAIAAEEV